MQTWRVFAEPVTYVFAKRTTIVLLQLVAIATVYAQTFSRLCTALL